MLKKTFESLLKKEGTKPLHCIDSSVFLESKLDTKLGEICKSHMNNMGKGKYFRGVIPVSVLGEINMVIFRDMAEPIERITQFELLEKFIRLRSVNIVVPKREDYMLVHDIMEVDNRLDELDAEHLVSAARSNADAFVTLDKHLVGNKTLESKLKLKIIHPEEL